LRGKPALLGVIQPLVADGLLASSAVRKPDKTFSLFTWTDDGSIVMDRLIAGCQKAAGLVRIPTDVMSVSALAQGLNLSRTQLGRKLAAAEAMGSLGWSGTRGKSLLWMSEGFRHEYHAAQAVKLAIIDAASWHALRMARASRPSAQQPGHDTATVISSRQFGQRGSTAIPSI
jgi:hypothetical protein